MSEIEDRIAAWLDGALGDEEAARFAADMERDPALAERVAAWASNDDLLRAAFNGPIKQGVDAALLARIGLGNDRPTPMPVPADVVQFKPAPRISSPTGANDNSPLRRFAWPLGGALAASIAAAMVLTGYPTPDSSAVVADARFAQAMEQLPSRGELVLPDRGRVSPVLSFAAADGRYCREFAIRGGPRPGGGIACKGPPGWSIEARSTLPGAAPDDARIVTAGGPDGAALDAAYARLGASDPLSGEAERALIAQGWKNASTKK